MSYRIGYFVGSLSSTSINRVLSRALISLAPPPSLEFHEIGIRDLPLYSPPDHDEDFPPEGRALKAAIESADGILFVTPRVQPVDPPGGRSRTRSTGGDRGRGGARTRSPASRPASSVPRPARSARR